VDYRIIHTEEALNDFRSILDYVAEDNPAAAERLGNALLDHIEILRSFPLIGARVKADSSTRKLLHTPYRIYYEVHVTRRVVEILHFWHGARLEPE
jgi:toxin ParE1/3/4